jgi:hypothetical protein
LWGVTAIAVKPFFPYVDFAAFYATAIDKILAGTPLDIYSFVARAPGSELKLALAHPPLWLFVLSPWYALGRAIGIDDFHAALGVSVGQAWMLALTLPVDVGLCFTIVRLVEGKQRLPEAQRLILFACLLLSPLLWLSSVIYGHNESWMVLAVLLAIAVGERGRWLLAGVLWGVALELKTTAIVPALTYFLWGLGKERRRTTIPSGLVAAATFVLPLVPYALFRREAVTYALVGFERIRPIGGYVMWKVIPGLDALAGWSNPIILAIAAAIGVAMARRPGRSFLDAGGAWALFLGQIAFLLFAKALFVWYVLAAGCFFFLAWARHYRGATTKEIVVVPLLVTFFLWNGQWRDWVGEGRDADDPRAFRGSGWRCSSSWERSRGLSSGGRPQPCGSRAASS